MGNSRSSKKSVTTFLEDYSGSAGLELLCFYKDEVLMRDCSVAYAAYELLATNLS